MKRTFVFPRKCALICSLVLLVAVSLAGPATTLAAGCDINGDGVVNLSDIAIFAYDFHNGYNARSDLNGDGVIDLSDVGILAACL